MSRNVTFVEDLPDVEYIDDHYNNSNHSHQVHKYLRQSHKPPMESGMNNEPRNTIQNEFNHTFRYSEPNDVVVSKDEDTKRQIHCIDVLNHLENCPICSRYYGRNDNMPYLIIIGVLSILCLMLIKKVIDSYGQSNVRYSRRSY